MRENSEFTKRDYTSGAGGQAPAIAQELCKDWKDSRGITHPGLYDEDSADMRRWAESFPHAVGGSLHLMEPSRYRNQFFESAKKLIPLGDIKFPPRAPKGDFIVLDDGTERKLNKPELSSLIQMDMMKEEMACMTRFKTQRGTVTYGLTPEKSSKMHDDRNYVAIMACWWIDHLQQDETFGDEGGLDFSSCFNKEAASARAERGESQSPWLKAVGSHPSGAPRHRSQSPFYGGNPFCE